jgi:hypothetical protein
MGRSLTNASPEAYEDREGVGDSVPEAKGVVQMHSDQTSPPKLRHRALAGPTYVTAGPEPGKVGLWGPGSAEWGQTPHWSAHRADKAKGSLGQPLMPWQRRH